MTADVSTAFKDWSATAGSNQPDNSDPIGPNVLAENLRQIQATIRAAFGGDDTIASASTCDIGSKDAGYIGVTGTTTITSFGTVSAGIIKVLKFSDVLLLTYNATSLKLPSAANVTTAANDFAIMRSLGSGNWECIGYFPASGDTVRPTVLRGWIAGLNMSTAGSSTTLTVAAGEASDSTNAYTLRLAASIGKTTSAWAVGTGNGGLDTGTIANSTWYHVHLIKRLDTGVTDVLFSLSVASPTLPSNYTVFRRIGSALTDSSGNWRKFFQDGEHFTWDVPLQDVNDTSPGTSAVSRTLTVPTGVVVYPKMMIAVVAAQSSGIRAIFTSLAQTDTPPVNGLRDVRAILTTSSVADIYVDFIPTNTSAQIRSRYETSTSGDVLNIYTRGWIDYRGRNA